MATTTGAAAAPSGAGREAAAALRQWEDANGVTTTSDEFFRMDQAKWSALASDKPWKRDPLYFNKVYMSALSVIKILMHAKTGKGKAGIISDSKDNWVEVMGLVQGHVRERTFIITDSFALPVDANEVECSLNEASQLYMIEYTEASGRLGKKEGVVGWYHSHPGYSAYLSGTDVPTQMNNQLHQDPFIALVVDPVQSISAGKVEIKAFRTYPEGYSPAGSGGVELEGVPLAKIEEFGYHANRYYQVPITVYRSQSDAHLLQLMWTKYWMQTLSSSPLLTGRLMVDSKLEVLATKIEKAEMAIHSGALVSSYRAAKHGSASKPDAGLVLTKSTAVNINEVLQGMMGMLVKEMVFKAAAPVAAA